MTAKRFRGRRPFAEENESPLETLMREAKRLGNKGDWGPDAIRINSRILELDPNNLAALTRRARCYFEQDDYAAAREDYQRALEIYPASKIVKESLARIEREWEASLERKRRKAALVRRRTKWALADATKLYHLEALTSFEEARAARWARLGGLKTVALYGPG